jgi:hypothetical protein
MKIYPGNDGVGGNGFVARSICPAAKFLVRETAEDRSGPYAPELSVSVNRKAGLSLQSRRAISHGSPQNPLPRLLYSRG